MQSNQTFRVNEPHVISEVIDGEVIILNFESGTYYSLNESGMFVWQSIQQGESQQDILTRLQTFYAADDDIISKDLASLLDLLQNEQLIVAGVSGDAPASLAIEQTDLPYEQLSLEKFTDLQDLLLLDPIHEVDEMGWPHQA